MFSYFNRNPNEFARHSNMDESNDKERKGLKLSKKKKTLLALGGTAVAIPTGAYLYGRNQLNSLRTKTAKSVDHMDDTWNKVAKEGNDLWNQIENPQQVVKKVPKTRAARVLNKIDDVWM